MSVTETLHCTICDRDFDRERRRGVKPKTCPGCKLAAEQEAEQQRAIRSDDSLIGRDGTLVLARNGLVVVTKGMLDLIRRYREWSREDAWLFAQYRSGEITRTDWIDLKVPAPVKMADLPSDDAWKLAARTGLLDA